MPSLDPPPMTRRDIADRFARDGYVFPVDVLSPDRAAAYRRDLEALERLGPTPAHRWSFAPVARRDPAEALRRLGGRAPLRPIQEDLFGGG